MPEYKHIQRQFGPVKSREVNFFYGHPQNRFWPLLAGVLGCELPQSIDGKKEMLLTHHIALWDTLDSCDIIGSSDSSIRNAEPVDIMSLLNAADIRQIDCNGTASYKLFMKYLRPVCGRTPVQLPSTSPANAAWSMDRLRGQWKQILEFLY